MRQRDSAILAIAAAGLALGLALLLTDRPVADPCALSRGDLGCSR